MFYIVASFCIHWFLTAFRVNSVPPACTLWCRPCVSSMEKRLPVDSAEYGALLFNTVEQHRCRNPSRISEVQAAPVASHQSLRQVWNTGCWYLLMFVDLILFNNCIYDLSNQSSRLATLKYRDSLKISVCCCQMLWMVSWKSKIRRTGWIFNALHTTTIVAWALGHQASIMLSPRWVYKPAQQNAEKKKTSWSSCTLRGKLLRRGKAGSQDIPLEEFLTAQQMQEVWVLVTCFWTSTVERETKDLRFGLAGCHSWSWLLSENRAGDAVVWSQVPMFWLESQFHFDTCWDINIQKYSDHAWGAAVLPHLRYIEKKNLLKKWRRTICDILLLHIFIGCKISVVSGFGMAHYIAKGYLWSIYVSSAVFVHHPKQTKRILHTINKSVCRRRWPSCSARVGPAHGITGHDTWS